MTAPFKLPEQNAIAVQAARLVDAGADEELILGVLRKGGLSLVDSIRLYGQLTNTPLLEAKKILLASHAWSHRFDRDAEAQARVAEALKALRADE